MSVSAFAFCSSAWTSCARGGELLPRGLGVLELRLLAELGDQRADLLGGLLEHRLELLLVALGLLLALLLEPLPLLLEPGARGLGLAGRGLGALELLGEAAAILLRGGERLGERATGRERELPGAGADLLVEPHPRRDLDRRRRAGGADLQLVGGEHAPRVEPDARVDEARVEVGERLELLEVGGDEHHRAARDQLLEHRDRERGALAGVGVRGDLVDQRERARAGGAGDLAQLDDVGAEGREPLREILRVADRRVDRPVERQPRAGRGGDRQAGGDHQRAAADRGEGDRLAARVRAGDHERARLALEDHVVADDRVALEDQPRVAHVAQLEAAAIRLEDRRVGVEIGGEPGGGLDLVELGDRLEPGEDPPRLAPDLLGELDQDLALLLEHERLRDREIVAEADHRLGLDEQRLPRLARVVDDARHLAAVLREHGEHVAAVADRVVGLAQVREEVVVVEQLVEPALDPPVEAAGAVAGLAQLGARAIRDLSVGLEAALEPLGEPLEQRHPPADRGQAGGLRVARLEHLAGADEREQRLGDRGELARLEHAALLGPIDRGAEIADRAQGEGELLLGELPALFDERERLGDLLGAVEERPGERAGAAGLGAAARAERAEDLGEGEVLEGAGIDLHGSYFRRGERHVKRG